MCKLLKRIKNWCKPKDNKPFTTSINDKGEVVITYPNGRTLRYLGEEKGWISE